MSVEINRRNLLTAAPAVGFAALVAGSVPVAAVAERSVEDQIAHHKAELFRLLSKTVPAGTVLTTALINLGDGNDFDILQAKPPGVGRNEYPIYMSDHNGNWTMQAGARAREVPV